MERYISIWNHIKIKGINGVGKVSEEEKCRIIWKADAVWDRMGLTNEQKALGIAIMNVESGFNHKVKGTSSTEKGLGQFTDPTWASAVNFYNDPRNGFMGINDPKLDPVLSREDKGAQITVTGAWVKRVWARALEVHDHPALKDKYDFIDIVYSAWHQGVGAYPEKDIVDKYGNITLSLKNYLAKWYTGTDIEEFLHNTYHTANGIFDDIQPAKDIFRFNPAQLDGYITGKKGSGETLERDPLDYRIVRRIEADGSTNGFFIS